MNKTELIAEVATKCAISKKDAEKTVNATFDTIAEALCKGDKVPVSYTHLTLPTSQQV